jgi:hypothetical protein
MEKFVTIAVLIGSLFSTSVSAKEFQNHTAMMDHGDGHLMDMDGGMVMGQNTDTLPGGCDKISATKEITVHAGHKYAEKFPGTMYAFDQQEFKFEPCTKLTVHFINDDEIRHQWMVHGLPKYLYPKGMFHLEVSGPGEVTGTMILPPGDKTYLVHCDIAQHMEKGMKAQLKVGKGSEDLPSIPGVTNNVFPDDYSGKPFNYDEAIAASAPTSSDTSPTAPASTPASDDSQIDTGLTATTVLGLAFGFLIAPLVLKQLKGKKAGEIANKSFHLIARLASSLLDLVAKLFKRASKSKTIPTQK